MPAIRWSQSSMFCFKRVIRLPRDLMRFQSHASSEIQLQVGILVQNKLFFSPLASRLSRRPSICRPTWMKRRLGAAGRTLTWTRTRGTSAWPTTSSKKWPTKSTTTLTRWHQSINQSITSWSLHHRRTDAPWTQYAPVYAATSPAPPAVTITNDCCLWL